MGRAAPSERYAERAIGGLDDSGAPERVVVWIDRREEGLWVVGRAIDPEHRPSDEPRPDDEIFSGYELDDALERANAALEDEVRVLEEEGLEIRVAPFTRKEILPKLERWFLRDS